MTALAFSEPALQSQAIFRAVMDAFARPGTVHEIAGVRAPAPIAAASAAVIIALADYETPVWLDAVANAPDVADWVKFQTGAALTMATETAAFAIVAGPQAMPDWRTFALGSEDYPDRSTTLIVQVQEFFGPALAIRGPGIKGTREISAQPLPPDFEARLAANRELYPRGVDLILTAGTRLMALPRSIIVGAG